MFCLYNEVSYPGRTRSPRAQGLNQFVSAARAANAETRVSRCVSRRALAPVLPGLKDHETLGRVGSRLFGARSADIVDCVLVP
jgi:hypothetical protein